MEDDTHLHVFTFVGRVGATGLLVLSKLFFMVAMLTMSSSHFLYYAFYGGVVTHVLYLIIINEISNPEVL